MSSLFLYLYWFNINLLFLVIFTEYDIRLPMIVYVLFYSIQGFGVSVCVPLNLPNQIPARVPDNNIFIKPDQSSQPLINIDTRYSIFLELWYLREDIFL